MSDEGFEKVAVMADLPEGTPVAVQLGGGEAVCLVRVGDEVFACEDRCSHAEFPMSDGEMVDDYVRADIYEAGWPSYGMVGRTLWEADQGSYEFALLLPSWIRDRTGRLLEFLPLGPIWPGFAINTIFYAAILWLPFAPFQLRRNLRVKHGLCIKCGYDLRGTEHEVCPECGVEM